VPSQLTGDTPQGVQTSPETLGFLHFCAGAAHARAHAHSAPAITAVKVVPRIGAEGDDGPLRPRFTSLPAHLDSITER